MRDQALFSRRAVAAALPFTAIANAPALIAAAAPGSDAALLDLGRRWEAIVDRFEAQRPVIDAMTEADFAATGLALEAENDELFRQATALFDEIVATPALTMGGLALKARILAHQNDSTGRDEAAIEGALRSAHCFLDKAAFSLALDIVRLAA